MNSWPHSRTYLHRMLHRGFRRKQYVLTTPGKLSYSMKRFF